MPVAILTGKGPDFSNVITKECGIGDYRLTYKLPSSSYSEGTQTPPFPSYLNLRADMFDSNTEQTFNRTHVTMGFGVWGYKGMFFQGSFGKLCRLSMHVDVNRAEGHTPIVEGDLSSLEKYLKHEYWNYYETDCRGGANWRARQKFKDNTLTKGEVPSQYLVRLPESYDRRLINNIEWLAYYIGPEGRAGYRHSYYWAYPLSDEYYLTIGFRMSFEVGDPKELRRERMLEDAQRIMSMVELRKE